MSGNIVQRFRARGIDSLCGFATQGCKSERLAALLSCDGMWRDGAAIFQLPPRPGWGHKHRMDARIFWKQPEMSGYNSVNKASSHFCCSYLNENRYSHRQNTEAIEYPPWPPVEHSSQP